MFQEQSFERKDVLLVPDDLGVPAGCHPFLAVAFVEGRRVKDASRNCGPEQLDAKRVHAVRADGAVYLVSHLRIVPRRLQFARERRVIELERWLEIGRAP